jgi:hypothetical protein
MRAFPDDLPGADRVRSGLADLAAGRETEAALLVSIGAGRLRDAGLDVPPGFPDPEHRLYRLLSGIHGDDAHSRYNALIRLLVSFERALECVK